MRITKVSIDSYEPKDLGSCAEVSIVIDNAIAIHKIQVINGEKGLFVAMPNTGITKIYNSKKRYEDIVHPVNKKLSEEISNEVLSVYKSYVPEN